MRSLRPSTFVSLVLGVVLALLAGSCGGGGDGADTTSAATLAATTTAATSVSTTVAAAQETASADGTFTVAVPAGQLAEPVTVTPSDLDTSFLGAEVDVLGAFDLGPEGAVFSEPATVTFRTGIPATPGEVPFLTVLYGAPDAWETPAETRVEVVNGLLVMTFALDHFSTVVPIWSGATIELRPSSFEGNVGAVFGVHLGPKGGPGVVLDFATESAVPFSTGVVDQGSWGTYADPGGEVPEFTFVCRSDGEGTYGMEVAVPITTSSWQGAQAVVETSGASLVPLQGTAVCRAPVMPWEVASGWSLTEDEVAGLIDSISSHLASFTQAWIDLEGFGASTIDVTAEQAGEWFQSPWYECGAALEDGPVVFCPDGVLDMPPGPMLVAVAQMAAAIPPADMSHSYVYSVVFDSDGEAANDWVFYPPYDWDYFRGADRWYQLIWDQQAATWSVTVDQVNEAQQVMPAESAVRVLVEGGRIVWLIPMSEFPGADPAVRFTTFGHDGMWSETDRGGDVSGADPTEPPIPISTFEMPPGL